MLKYVETPKIMGLGLKDGHAGGSDPHIVATVFTQIHLNFKQP